MAQETTSPGCPWGNHQGPTGAKVQLLQPVLLVVLFACANFLGESLGAGDQWLEVTRDEHIM